MKTRLHLPLVLAVATVCVTCAMAPAQTPATEPARVYVPYENLKTLMANPQQSVFMPYAEFQRLWRAAQGSPAGVEAAPTPYLISTARFAGKVGTELATLDLELTVDILVDDWVEVPLGLSDAAVAEASFVDANDAKVRPLLLVVDGKYSMLTKGKGRRTLKLQFVRQLVSQPGLNVLSFGIPQAAITTLNLLIPEENMKVDVKPMLAATTTQVDLEGGKGKATELRAFLGSSDSVQLSWKPKTQAAGELEPVVIAEQLERIDVGESLIAADVRIAYDIRRRGVDSFTIQLPGDFRITAVEGADISKWDIAGPATGPAAADANSAAPQVLQVKLFSAAKDSYVLTIRMERFLKESEVRIPLSPVLTQQALRQTGLLAVTHSPRRSVEIRDLKNLARVDAGRLPADVQRPPGITAWRFVTADYGATMAIGTVAPRINLQQLWSLGVEMDRLQLSGQLSYQVERAGVYELLMNLPEPWELVSVGPPELVDDHQFTGKGAQRMLRILLKRETIGAFNIQLRARMVRAKADDDVSFAVPMADEKDLQDYGGQVVLQAPEALRAEVGQLRQLSPLPLAKAHAAGLLPGLSPVMAFEFRAIDRTKPAGADFKMAVRPAQVSAVVYRLVNIQPGSIEEEAVFQYRVLYAPVDTFYVKMPSELAQAGVQITGANIKEKPRIDQLPPDQAGPDAQGAVSEGKMPSRRAGETPATLLQGASSKPAASVPSAAAAPDGWAYYKVVLQSPVTGNYRFDVHLRRSFRADEAGAVAAVRVDPILAAGKLSDQSGTVAVAKAETLAIGQPKMENLIPADPGSPQDLPYQPHREVAALAFKYNAPPFALSLPVAVQKEAAVFTTIATAAVVEQVLARDGTLNTHAIYLLATSRGDRLAITLPAGAKLFSVLLNGAEAPVEAGATADQRIVRLPPSAGQVARVVLEISYGLDKAVASSLEAPALPADLPVQQTLWRLWSPSEDHMIWHNRDAAAINSYEADAMMSDLSTDFHMPVAFKLARQGQVHDFIRQGPPKTLSVRLVGKEAFAIVLWVVLIVAGAAMLKLHAFARAVVVLIAAAVMAAVQLFAPLLVQNMLKVGAWAVLLVAALWLAQWLFIRLPRAWRAGKPAAAFSPAPASPAAGARPTERTDRKGE